MSENVVERQLQESVNMLIMHFNWWNSSPSNRKNYFKEFLSIQEVSLWQSSQAKGKRIRFESMKLPLPQLLWRKKYDCIKFDGEDLKISFHRRAEILRYFIVTAHPRMERERKMSLETKGESRFMSARLQHKRQLLKLFSLFRSPSAAKAQTKRT